MHRRPYLSGIGITIAGLAGCTSNGQESSLENGDNSTADDDSSDGEDDNSNGSQSGSEQVSITGVELRTQEVTVGEEVELEISLDNESEYPIEYPITIEANEEVIGQRELTLNQKAVTTIVYTWEPEEKGEYDLTVNGVTGGTVSVQ